MDPWKFFIFAAVPIIVGPLKFTFKVLLLQYCCAVCSLGPSAICSTVVHPCLGEYKGVERTKERE